MRRVRRQYKFLMPLPKLRMNKPDIETAICSEFRKQFKNLIFVPKTDVVRIDGNPLVTLKRDYDVPGSYPVIIQASLFIDNKEAQCYHNVKYKLETDIDITYGEDNQPVVTFNSSVGIKKIM